LLKKGLNPADVAEHKKESGSVKGFAGTKNITNDTLLELDVDVLVPAALENQITIKNAKNIKANIVVELANGPTTPDADAILFAKKKLVIPDVLANAGGVTVSYFEWVQNRTQYYWSEEEVLTKLQPLIETAYDAAYFMQQRHKVDMRTATLMSGIKRVADAIEARGLYS
jgi:glutamate dehydrogenase/leucine dehydrogenase